MATANLTARPSKPHPDYPLFPHTRGYWCKKVKGRLVYFTKWRDDPKGEHALEQWLDQKDDLLAGRVPRPNRGELTVSQACGTFLQSKWDRVEAGRLTQRHYKDLKDAAELVVKTFGPRRVVSDLSPADFRNLRKRIEKGRGVYARTRWNKSVRAIFRYAYENDLIRYPVKFGTEFDPPTQDEIRKHKEDKDRLVEPHEIRHLLDAADTPMRCWILLGINCGLGNADLCWMEFRHLDLDAATLKYARRKTGMPRRSKLWPETVTALREWLEIRPEPKRVEHTSLVFLTQLGGPCGFEDRNYNKIGQRFSALLRKEKLQRDGVSFYSLRHTYRTAADGCKDQVAIDVTMGHATAGMGSKYRHRVDDERLIAVSDHVRQWLLCEGVNNA